MLVSGGVKDLKKSWLMCFFEIIQPHYWILSWFNLKKWFSTPTTPRVLTSFSNRVSEVMDRNRDGKLMMEEVEQCLIPGTYRYREFHKALKLSTPEGFKVGRGWGDGWLLGDVGDGRGKKREVMSLYRKLKELYVCTTSNTDDWQSTVNQMIYKSSYDSVSTVFS